MEKILVRKNVIYTMAAFSLLAAGYILGELIEIGITKPIANEKEQELRISGYKYVNPLLECNIDGYQSEPNVAKFAKMKTDIVKRIENDSNRDVAVYFRDLSNGPWLGLNEKEFFTPASLLKVPLMITLFKQKEIQPTLFDKKIAYKKQVVLPQDIDGEYDFVNGKEYTIKDLIKIMIVYSNNEATEILLSEIDAGILKKVYSDFNLPMPGSDNKTEDFMTVRQYASFFRILYNASYLSAKDSEEALSIMSKSTFKNGLVAGLPAEVEVVHKFGERKYLLDGKETNQLHDCGVVYAKDKNYIMCVMTRGYDFSTMEKTIKDISGIVYDSFVEGR